MPSTDSIVSTHANHKGLDVDVANILHFSRLSNGGRTIRTSQAGRTIRVVIARFRAMVST